MHWITSTAKPILIKSDEIWYPVLNIKKLNPVLPKSVDIAIFTSQHGFIDCNFNQRFAIGLDGLTNIIDLKKAIQSISGRQIVYFRGRDVTDDLSFLAKNNDFNSIIIYEANFITQLSPELLDLLQNNKIADVEIKSQRSFESFKQILAKYNIDYKGLILNNTSKILT